MGFCIEAAAILADKKDLEEKFKSIGIKLGLLFQITDDFLDKYGNSISVTSSIENSFGSRLFVNGFLLNNQLFYKNITFFTKKSNYFIKNEIKKTILIFFALPMFLLISGKFWFQKNTRTAF